MVTERYNMVRMREKLVSSHWTTLTFLRKLNGEVVI